MSNPFEIPNIVHEKIQLEEILKELQITTKIQYMPTSLNVAKVNSKPHYSRSSIPEFPEFPNVTLSEIGFYQFDEYYYTTQLFTKVPNKHLFKYIVFKNVRAIINLNTLEAIITSDFIPNAKWYSWLPGPDYAVAIDNYVFNTETI